MVYFVFSNKHCKSIHTWGLGRGDFWKFSSIFIACQVHASLTDIKQMVYVVFWNKAILLRHALKFRCGKKYKGISHQLEVSAHTIKYKMIYFKYSAFVYWLVRWNPYIKKSIWAKNKLKEVKNWIFGHWKTVFSHQLSYMYTHNRIMQ